jgi:hypothetical protein
VLVWRFPIPATVFAGVVCFVTGLLMFKDEPRVIAFSAVGGVLLLFVVLVAHVYLVDVPVDIIFTIEQDVITYEYGKIRLLYFLHHGNEHRDYSSSLR